MLMAPPILLPPPTYSLLKEPKIEETPLVFDASLLQNESNIPQQFVWPDNERPCFEPPPPLQVPPIDLQAFLSGDPLAVSNTTQIVKSAFFQMPLSEKQRAQRKLGDSRGYASSFTNRFSSKLPWKETLTLQYSADLIVNTVTCYRPEHMQGAGAGWLRQWLKPKFFLTPGCCTRLS